MESQATFPGSDPHQGTGSPGPHIRQYTKDNASRPVIVVRVPPSPRHHILSVSIQLAFRDRRRITEWTRIQFVVNIFELVFPRVQAIDFGVGNSGAKCAGYVSLIE